MTQRGPAATEGDNHKERKERRDKALFLCVLCVLCGKYLRGLRKFYGIAVQIKEAFVHAYPWHPYYYPQEFSQAAQILAAKKRKRRKTGELFFCAFCAFSRLSSFGCGWAHARQVKGQTRQDACAFQAKAALKRRTPRASRGAAPLEVAPASGVRRFTAALAQAVATN